MHLCLNRSQVQLNKMENKLNFEVTQMVLLKCHEPKWLLKNNKKHMLWSCEKVIYPELLKQSAHTRTFE